MILYKFMQKIPSQFKGAWLILIYCTLYLALYFKWLANPILKDLLTCELFINTQIRCMHHIFLLTLSTQLSLIKLLPSDQNDPGCQGLLPLGASHRISWHIQYVTHTTVFMYDWVTSLGRGHSVSFTELFTKVTVWRMKGRSDCGLCLVSAQASSRSRSRQKCRLPKLFNHVWWRMFAAYPLTSDMMLL